jgi:hypothetical protein
MISKKYMVRLAIAAAVVFFMVFPEYLFTILGILLLIVILVFFIVEFAFDIYIVIAVITKWFRDK